MCAGAYLCYLTGLAKVSAAASGVFALLAVLSGASYFTLSFNALKRRGHGDMMLSSVIDVIFLATGLSYITGSSCESCINRGYV
jgi:uncharacterized membrane protein HdeD (DUF308 family)